MQNKDLIILVKNRLQGLESYSKDEEYLLIELALNLTRTQVLFQKEFSKKQVIKVQKVLSQRLKGKPLNKIFHKQNFFGYDFYINKHVLAPRQETELVVERAIELAKNLDSPKFLDLCCGSGCIGLTVAKEVKTASVMLCDISSCAIRVAKRNAKILGVETQVKFCKSDMFEHLKKEENFDIIISNPPYISSNSCNYLQMEVKGFDPLLALDGGDDGLNFYRTIAKNAGRFLTKKGILVLEIGFDQKQAVEKLLKENEFVDIKTYKDYASNDRVVVALKG